MAQKKKLKQAGLAAGAFALGAAIGSSLALLYAPASGKVTRKRISNRFHQAQRQLAKKAGKLRETAVERIGQTKEWMMEHVPNGNGKHAVHRSKVRA